MSVLKINSLFLIILIFFFKISFGLSEEIFVSLKKDKVNVRYGPSFNFPIKFIYQKKNLPIKQIDKKDNFRRIIDHKKNSGWIHISQLKKVNSVITLKDKILFENSSVFSEPLARIQTGRLLIIRKCENKWCKVETGSYKGWIDTNFLWGKIN